MAEKEDGQFVFKVGRVLNEWKISRANDAEALIGKNVLVHVGEYAPILRFVALLERGAEVSLDVAHKDGEVSTIVELTEEQRELVKY